MRVGRLDRILYNGVMRDPEENRTFLTGLWRQAVPYIAVTLVSVLAILSTALLARRAAGMAIGGMLVVFAALFVVTLYRSRGAAERRLRQLLRDSPTPRPLLEYVRDSMQKGRLPHSDCMYAGSAAMLLALYGAEDAAEDSLRSVDWRGRPPIVRALTLGAEAQIAILCRRDFEAALSALRRGRAMADPGGDFPGAQTAANFWDGMVEACQMMTDVSADDHLARVEARLARGPIVTLELMLLWALAVGYAQRGDFARAQEYARRHRNIAPHCVPPL